MTALLSPGTVVSSSPCLYMEVVLGINNSSSPLTSSTTKNQNKRKCCPAGTPGNNLVACKTSIRKGHACIARMFGSGISRFLRLLLSFEVGKFCIALCLHINEFADVHAERPATNSASPDHPNALIELETCGHKYKAFVVSRRLYSDLKFKLNHLCDCHREELEEHKGKQNEKREG